ncbi:uncharacterized membrane protein YoaK (UPF0700 family) [Flavobacterium sp. 270]|uniref:YoaK family protein n=1 Tax=Flavobacterium sp. 270 TaxID=2512114 RepID=UPI0010E09460|nr:YoaK family protein [Flavobacterium sp. 270]TDW43376.1 uncharacterized membrane protein YoaK (UPF0700 family) [Flavobacterium sp. 270]
MIAEVNSTKATEQVITQEKLAIILACIAGYLDAVGIVKWKTYVSFMSGNTTQLGISISNGKHAVIMTSVTVISCFLFGIYTGTCLSLWKKYKIQKLPFYIVSGILIFYTTVSFYYTISVLQSLAIIGFSTGIMNTIVTSVGNQKINTDFVTGTLNSLAKNTAMLNMATETAERKEYKTNAIRLFLLWLGFLSGAFTAPFLLPLLKNWILMLPAFLLLLCSLLKPVSIINQKN